ncbi:MAG TPA: adenylate/guanylate cyclase domain-containing protein, partial [Acidimicrobiales bacterium]|nr:adenylate/guanylate cyclase domain-containing protein [Acidimicrobiales bacterium]
MDLPAGYLTLVLTDIAGSTAAWDTDPEATDAALQHHDGVLAKTIADHGGLVLKQKGEGDSTFSVFVDAVDAVSAAIAFLARLEADDFPLPVRVAVHSGDLVPRAGDYYGPVPNRAARIRALADGRQVLLSAATAAAVRGRLPGRVELLDMGEHELRGLSRPEHVHAVSHPDLPPVAPIGDPLPPPGNLPAPIDRFVGRDEERIVLDKALRQHRLVTVVGPGGIGKSRLALQMAAEQAGEHPDGTWVVDVADHDRAEQLAAAVADVLEVVATPGGEVEAIADALRRPSLIVLDTCEAQLEAAAAFADQLLRIQPRAVVLATSREPLGVAGEAVLRLEPMTPDTGARELFLTRAAAADLTIGAIDGGLVERICLATDGVPLAIELVAGRLAVDAVHDVASSLDDLDALLGPDAARRRSGPTRQRTLVDTIRWSTDALNEAERDVLVRLTVFAGGWPADAAADVCADPDGLDPATARFAIQELTRRSLVVVDRADRDRLRLLDTVREVVQQLYGPPAGDVRARHLAWATERAEAIDVLPIDVRRTAYNADRANIRAAFAHALEIGAAEHAHRLAYAQTNVFVASRQLDEALATIVASLSLGDSPRREAAQAALGFVTAMRGDLEEAERLLSECRDAGIEDPEIRSDVLNGLVMIASINGRSPDEFVELARAAVDAARAVPDSNALPVALNNL